MKIEKIRPEEIEARSFAIIREELEDMGIRLPQENAAVILRCIHTSADFDYAKNLIFSPEAVEQGVAALREGCSIVTDTRMGWSGLNKKRLEKLGGKAYCFMTDEDVAREAKERGITRAAVSMEKAAALEEDLIFAIGNAPTAQGAGDHPGGSKYGEGRRSGRRPDLRHRQRPHRADPAV